MKVYKVSLLNCPELGGEHAGYFYTRFSTKVREYLKEHHPHQLKEKGWRDEYVHTYNVSVTKEGVIDFMNRYGSHPDNG
jgi:hypothetical protein